MRLSAFSSRNSKEILRDPINLVFGIGFPVALILLFQAIQSNIPIDIYNIKNLIPGVAVFGLSFVSLFSSILISKDRGSSFLMRLFATPLSASDFILGYILPLLPMAMLQCAVSYLVGVFYGIPFDLNLLAAVLTLIPPAFLFIGIGLLCGTMLNEKQVGGICGALLTNLSAFLSGAWFDLNLVGGWFKKIAYAFPFAHAVNAGRAALNGDYTTIFPELLWVTGYAAGIIILAVIVFRRKMSTDKM